MSAQINSEKNYENQALEFQNSMFTRYLLVSDEMKNIAKVSFVDKTNQT